MLVFTLLFTSGLTLLPYISARCLEGPLQIFSTFEEKFVLQAQDGFTVHTILDERFGIDTLVISNNGAKQAEFQLVDGALSFADIDLVASYAPVPRIWPPPLNPILFFPYGENYVRFEIRQESNEDGGNSSFLYSDSSRESMARGYWMKLQSYTVQANYLCLNSARRQKSRQRPIDIRQV